MIKMLVGEMTNEQRESLCNAFNVPIGKDEKATTKNLVNAIDEGQVRIAVTSTFKQAYPDAANPDVNMPVLFAHRCYNYKESKLLFDAQNPFGMGDPDQNPNCG